MMDPIQEFFSELFTQLKTSVPASLNAMGNSLPWLISVAFVGRIGADELAAAALATSICNVTGLSIATGMSSAVATFTGQCKGEMERRQKNQQKGKNWYQSIQQADKECSEDTTPVHVYPITPQTYLYRGVAVQLMFVLPVGIYWIMGIESLLISLGQQESIAAMSSDYLKILTPGLWAYSINFTLSTWLQAIGMADVPMYGVIVGTVLHIPLNIFFIYFLGLGFQGAAVATTIFQIIQPTVSLFYIYMTISGRDRVYIHTGADTLINPIPFLFELKRAIFSVKGICQYLSLAIPGLVLISEWWASELALILSGRLSNAAVSLAAFAIFQSVITVCFKFAAGVSIACAARVSILLGAMDAKGARFASKVSISYVIFVEFSIACVLFFTPHKVLPSFFTPDVEVIEAAAKTLPYLALYNFCDGLQYTLNGVIRGVGKQCIVMPIAIFSYWIVGLPLAYFVTFGFGNSENEMVDTHQGPFDGILGLVFGMTVGTCIHFLLMAIVVGFGINWDVEVIRARERITYEQNEKMNSETNEKEKLITISL